VWMGTLLSWKIASLIGNNVWIMGCTWLPNLSTYSLAVIRPWRVIMGPQNTVPQYCCLKHHKTSPVFHCWNQAFRIVGFLGCSSNVNSSWCRKQREGRLIWSVQLSDVQVLWSWHHRLRIWALLSVVRGLAFAALPWIVGFVKLTSDSFVETGLRDEYSVLLSCRLCCSISMIFRNNPSQCSTIAFCQCWISPTVPLRWCCLPMIRVCRHKLRNCRPRYT
jgi:hypothetical protein